MKIQISFTTRKNSRSVFNENIDWFVTRKNSRPVINEDKDLFCILEKNVLLIISRFWNQRKKIKTYNQLKNVSKKILTKHISVTNMNWEQDIIQSNILTKFMQWTITTY